MNNIQQAVVKVGTVLTVGKVIAIKNDHVLVDSTVVFKGLHLVKLKGF